MIHIKDLSVHYPSVIAIDNLSMKLEDGCIYGLIGSNGSGKSSLIKAMVGMISEYAGEIYYDNLLLEKNRHRLKEQFGYAPEDVELTPFLTGNEYLNMIADLRKLQNKNTQINFLIEILGLIRVENDLINTYSHGMKKKLSLAAALVSEPKYIILDEALNGLDTMSLLNTKKLLKNLSAKGHIILLSSHVLEIVENWCHKILVLHHGKLIVQYTKEEIVRLKDDDGLDFNERVASLIKQNE